MASVIWRFTSGLPHHPLFQVTHFALKCSNIYNLTVGALRLLGNSSPYFEVYLTAFHTWPFLDISFADCWLRGFRKFQIYSCCFLCTPPSHFFPSICNKYTTSPETYIKDLANKWNIYYRFDYIGPSFPSSILNQIPVSFSPLLSLSGYLVIFPKMS